MKSEVDYLMEVLDFKQADLEANRQGVMTKHQQRILERIKIKQSNYYFINFISLLVLFAAPTFLVFQLEEEMRWLVILALPVLITFLIVFVNKAQADNQLITQEIRSKKVASKSGLVVLGSRRASHGKVVYIVYEVRLENLKIKVRQQVFACFHTLEPYTLYYSPQTKTLLAAEPRPDLKKSLS